ncbi:hypothetical protein AGLY_018344 [Aphis glycines]|uniref:Transmembrane protein n=1 Tax=Aphis glycines TaxID=307491 RepID=A0A6G0SSL0_APHGL|nr:hypothetical protein AGLY_018344 [Aphis glycines]
MAFKFCKTSRSCFTHNSKNYNNNNNKHNNKLINKKKLIIIKSLFGIKLKEPSLLNKNKKHSLLVAVITPIKRTLTFPCTVYMSPELTLTTLNPLFVWFTRTEILAFCFCFDSKMFLLTAFVLNFFSISFFSGVSVNTALLPFCLPFLFNFCSLTALGYGRILSGEITLELVEGIGLSASVWLRIVEFEQLSFDT